MKHLCSTLLVVGFFSANLSVAESVWDNSNENYEGELNITVYHDPKCGCCKDWVAHLHKHGFEVEDIKTTDMPSIKQRLGLPEKVASCHTAVIDNYLIEGHVPADDIKRLLKQKPDIHGLSVPAMPVGTPGMERGERKDPFAVISFDKEGNTEAFKQYWTY